jgi:hypothetical protein
VVERQQRSLVERRDQVVRRDLLDESLDGRDRVPASMDAGLSITRAATPGA